MKYIVVGFKHKANGEWKDKWVCVDTKKDALKIEKKWIDKGFDSVSVCTPISSTDYETADDVEKEREELCGLVIPEGYIVKLGGYVEEGDLLFTDYPSGAKWDKPRANAHGRVVHDFHGAITPIVK